MSQWTDRVRNHVVWQQLSALGPVIDQAMARESNEPVAIEGLQRLRAVLAFSGKRLAAIDPFLVHVPPLDGMASFLQNATTEVQTFIADGNAGHLTNANAHADSVLTHLAQLHAPFAPDDLTAISESAASYRAALEQYLKEAAASHQQFKSEVDALKTKLAELTTSLNTERQRIASLVSEHQSQFSTAQEARGREFTDAQSARQDKYVALVTDYAQKLTEQNAEFTRQREAAIKNHTDELGNFKNQYEQSANAILAEIEDHKRQVEKLVGVIGNLGVTSGYQKAANEARTTTRVWQIVAVLSMLGLITLSYFAFLPLVAGDFTWSGFAGRVFVSLTAGALAAYAASQADKYQKIERHSRKLALELEAIGPFLAPLEKNKQEEFRLKIGDRSFGHGDAGTNISEKSPATVLDTVFKSKEFAEFVAGIVKAAK